MVHLYSLLIAKDHFHSCIFSMVSSLYLPFSFPSARDLALRSRIFLRSLSSFSLVMTTCKGNKTKNWVGKQVMKCLTGSGTKSCNDRGVSENNLYNLVILQLLTTTLKAPSGHSAIVKSLLVTHTATV